MTKGYTPETEVDTSNPPNPPELPDIVKKLNKKNDDMHAVINEAFDFINHIDDGDCNTKTKEELLTKMKRIKNA